MKKSKELLYLLLFLLPLSLSGCALQHLSDNSKVSNTISESGNVNESSSESSSENENGSITIAEAIKIANEAGETGTNEEYQITGTIEKVSNSTYGEMTVKDDTGSLFIYGVFDKDRETRYDAFEDKPVKGDEITLLGKLKMFDGKPEMDRGYMQSFKHVDVSENIDLTQYAETTILNARSVETGTKMKLTGTVTRITYAFGMEPNGFYLIGDNSSIYVYGGDIASQVSEGNKITIACEKSYFILEDEKTHAATFGYQGSCQVDNVYLISNDKKTNEIDLSWCETTTVKEILNTPLTDNITTNIYKVNAVVNKSEGSGFTNYYFDDLDNATGSYTYTMCNGNDFTWLNEFDGKICTVYLSAINCKSTKTGCIYRFIPIKVIDENYTFDLKDAPEHVLEYYIEDQFLTSYEGNPEQEVITSVSSELLGFENATVSYESNNTDVVYFETVDNKTIFNTKNVGEATITATATYQTYSATREIKITVKTADNIEYVNVKNAIDATLETTVTVKGIVTSAVANKASAFYLSDETGIIAVQLTSTAELAKIKPGQEVIVSGTRTKIKDTQSCIDGATVVSNLQGNHAYSTASFETISFSDLCAKANDKSVDQTTKAYTVTAKVTKKVGGYSTTYSLTENSSDSILFYSGSPSQYSYLLDAYDNQTITMEVMLCDWNAKGYKLCAIAVVTSEGKTIQSCNWN